MAQTWALLATAATVMGVLRDKYGARRSAVGSTPTQHSQHPAEHPRYSAALSHTTLPLEVLAIMVIINGAVQQLHQQPKGCVRA